MKPQLCPAIDIMLSVDFRKISTTSEFISCLVYYLQLLVPGLCISSRLWKCSKISDLLKALDERKSPPRDITTHMDPRNISTSLFILKNPRTDTSSSHWDLRAGAALPENICQLSKCKFKRCGHLSVGLSKSVASDVSAKTIPKKQIYPHVLGVMPWTKQLSCEPSWTQTVPTNWSENQGKRDCFDRKWIYDLNVSC